MTFKFRKIHTTPKVLLPTYPEQQKVGDTEALTGMVHDMQASRPEEMLAREYDRRGIGYIFRYVFGAPKGLPGWKELDFLVSYHGLLYAQEVDTAFTHREKAFKDVLHDALILNDPEINSMGTLYPHVTHVDGDTELADGETTKAFVSRFFGT